MRYIILMICSLAILFSSQSCKQDNKINNTTKENNANLPITGDTEIDFMTKQISKSNLDPNLRYERAKLLHDREMYDEAIEDLRVAITIDSLQPAYYHLLSDVFMDYNISNKALQTMEMAKSLFPERIPTLLKLAETHFIIKQYDQSISVLNSIIGLDPQNAEAYFMLGLNFREIGETKRAMNALQTATEFDAKLIDAWLVLGEILEVNGSEKAIDYFEAAVNIEPDNVHALHSLAFYKQNNDDIEGAIELYRKINGIDKFYSDAYTNAGILYLELNDYEKALEQFEILVSQRQLDPNSHFYKGYTYYLMNNFEAAKVNLQNALNLDENFERAKNLLSQINE